jgi:hypothetical protein
VNPRIYIGSDYQSILQYVQCASMKILLSYGSSSAKLIASELQARVLAFVWSPFLHAAWATFYI